MKIIKHFRKNSAIWLFLLFFWSICLVILSLYAFDTVETHLFINQFTTDILDAIMSKTTHLGDGLFMIILTIVCFFFSARYFFNFTLTGLMIMPIVYVLKRYFESQRPFSIFSQLGRLDEIYIPEQETINQLYSFPSGHAAIAFSMGVTCALLSKKTKDKFLWLFLAVFVSSSRVYLSQHFLEDILVGSILGSIFSFVGYEILDKWELNTIDFPVLTWWKKK
jgi:membrane-associated phospholipid phosphatase